MLLGIRLATLQRVQEIIVGAEGPDDGAHLLGRLRGGAGRGAGSIGRLIALLAQIARLLFVILLALASAIALRRRRCRCGRGLGRLAHGPAQGSDPLGRRDGSGTLLLSGHQAVAQGEGNEEQAAGK